MKNKKKDKERDNNKALRKAMKNAGSGWMRKRAYSEQLWKARMQDMEDDGIDY